MPSADLTKNATAFRKSLIDWYDTNARDLPWRRKPSLYKTVVSEFMLQQTQIKTALPYFAAWLKRFPSFKALSQATEEDVLKSWEGLGYYSRARNLLKLAKEIAKLKPADIPTDAKSWLPYPGIGPYAAAAVCSISFNDPSAVIDGNVVRILSRLCADETPYKNSTDAAKAYRELADALLNTTRPGDHNQAMMELGATICHKQSPKCLLCPANTLCEARKQGIEESLPRLEKRTYEELTVSRAWIQGPNGILLHKIPANAKRMSGLHELPTIEQLSISLPNSTTPTIRRKRSITKYRITENIYTVASKSLSQTLPVDCIWATPIALAKLPFSGPHRRWVDELLKAET